MTIRAEAVAAASAVAVAVACLLAVERVRMEEVRLENEADEARVACELEEFRLGSSEEL